MTPKRAAATRALRDLRDRCARAAERELDDCTHPECVEERKQRGYSTCAGGHLARRVGAAVRRISYLESGTGEGKPSAGSEPPRDHTRPASTFRRSSR